MFNMTRCLSNTRLMKALTGVSPMEFRKLLATFTVEFSQQQTHQRPERERCAGAGRRHTLATPAEKLFFILLYVKCYPTFDVASLLFQVDRSQPCRWVQAYLPVLEATLGREVVLPARQIASVAEFLVLFPQVQTVFVDGTERPVRRPHDKVKQQAFYSGKKKRHTVKNIVLTDTTKRILVVSATVEGKRHDKTVATQAAVFDPLPPEVPVHGDLGFQGVQKAYPALQLIIPQKKSPKHTLSAEAKAANRQKAKVRVKVEHALGGVKRLRVVADVFRNQQTELADRFMVVACGLWNYHLKLVA